MFKLKVLAYAVNGRRAEGDCCLSPKKADAALVEARDCALLGHWSLTANRLYYAAYYVSSALLIDAGHAARIHEGTIGMIGQYYVRTGILTNEDGILLARLQNMRHAGDYDDFLDWAKEDVEPYIPKVEAFIEKVKTIITAKRFLLPRFRGFFYPILTRPSLTDAAQKGTLWLFQK